MTPPTTTSLPEPGADDVLYLVDLHCFMHRFWVTMQGRCAHGFISFFSNLLRFQAPSHVAVCTDLPHPTFRSDLYPKAANGTGYKAHREPPDPTLLERLRWSREMIEDVHGVPVYGRRGYEADDLIAALTKHAKEDGLRVVILALDKDLTQLVDEHCVMWDGKKSVVGPDEVRAKFGVRPSQMRDYLAIVGDASDNIPGVHGLGPVAAKEILAAHGSLTEALDVANKLPSRSWHGQQTHREALRKHTQEAKLSMQLVSLAYDAPVPYDREALRR